MKIIIGGKAVEIPSGGGSPGGVPKGTIVIWGGTADNIPSGWALCDGQDGRPDLRDKFVLGAGEIHTVGETGGEETHVLNMEEMPRHAHSVPFTANTGSSNNRVTSGTTGAQNGTITVGTTGGGTGSKIGESAPHNNMPPYYALCYIIKVSADPTDGVTMDQVNEAIDTKLDAYTPQEVYSTEETRIGTWIDGKPLYRKVIELTLPSTASGSSSYSGHTLPAEINPVNYYGMCISTNGHKMPLYGGNYTYAVINPANQIYVAAFQGDYASALLILTVEYTKTTDGSFEW